jgi:GNAT superfamily N-acetyltransferase
MDEDYQIIYEEKPEESAWGIIGRGVGSFNRQHAGDDKFQRLCFTLRGSDEEIAGGVIGELFFGWFHVDLLWVKEELRGYGYGQRLLARIEAEARQRGAKNIYLDTFSFQAPDFYKKYGYEIFGTLPDFPPGHQRYFLKKQL